MAEIMTHVGLLLVGLLLLLSVAWWASRFSASRWRGAVGWRVRAVSMMLQGRLPYMSWPDLLFVLVRFLIRPPQMPWKGHPKIEVVAKGRGEAPCPVHWETPLGDFWGRETDGPLLAGLLGEQLFGKVYQREPVAIRPGDVVFDAGAHLGTFTRLALQQGARLVIAFEPDPTNIRSLERTFGPEVKAGRVVLVEAALWSIPGTLSFNEEESGVGGSVVLPRGGLLRGDDGTLHVPATTIDETVHGLNLERVDFIKMDIEGAERRALHGGRKTLSRFGPRMALSIYHLRDDREVIPRLVLEARPAYHFSFSASGEQAYFY